MASYSASFIPIYRRDNLRAAVIIFAAQDYQRPVRFSKLFKCFLTVGFAERVRRELIDRKQIFLLIFPQVVADVLPGVRATGTFAQEYQLIEVGFPSLT